MCLSTEFQLCLFWTKHTRIWNMAGPLLSDIFSEPSSWQIRLGYESSQSKSRSRAQGCMSSTGGSDHWVEMSSFTLYCQVLHSTNKCFMSTAMFTGYKLTLSIAWPLSPSSPLFLLTLPPLLPWWPQQVHVSTSHPLFHLFFLSLTRSLAPCHPPVVSGAHTTSSASPPLITQQPDVTF